MWLVSRIVDYDYEGDKKIPLFVSDDETFAKDWTAAANIEVEAGATLKKPVEFRPAFDGMRRRDGTVYFTREEHKKQLELFYAEARNICKLDTTLDDSDLESLSMFSYECEPVGVGGPVKPA